MKPTQSPTEIPDIPAVGSNGWLSQWREWERRTGNNDSKLELYSDGSGVFDERDLFGPTHSFETLSELRAIWDNEKLSDRHD